MISTIRKYFKDVIALIDSDMTQIDDPIGDDQIGSMNSECRYKIIIGEFTLTNRSNYRSDLIPVDVVIYSSNGRDMIDIFDTYYDKSINIVDHCLNPESLSSDIEIDSITGGNITPESVTDTNDKTIKFTLKFDVIRNIKYC